MASAAVVPVQATDSCPTERHWYVKSNLPAWLMLWTNVAGEIDLNSRWSVSLPVYYSGFNYFSSTRKYRVLAAVPEARFWFNRGRWHLPHDGWFVNAHFGFAFFNYAKGGDNRYQDHDGKTPAWGGGVGGGYRLNLGKSGRWKLEFVAGIGVYALDYDIFQNRHNGFLIGRKKRTAICIDNVAVSLCRTFDLDKHSKKGKGGRE